MIEFRLRRGCIFGFSCKPRGGFISCDEALTGKRDFGNFIGEGELNGSLFSILLLDSSVFPRESLDSSGSFPWLVFLQTWLRDTTGWRSWLLRVGSFELCLGILLGGGDLIPEPAVVDTLWLDMLWVDTELVLSEIEPWGLLILVLFFGTGF